MSSVATPLTWIACTNCRSVGKVRPIIAKEKPPFLVGDQRFTDKDVSGRIQNFKASFILFELAFVGPRLLLKCLLFVCQCRSE